MTGLLSQLQAFLLTLILGIITGVIFHFYQAIIRAARVKRLLLYVLDFFLWIIIIGLVFGSLLFINQGEMRVYVLLALLLGILIYYRCFAHRLDNAIAQVVRAFIFICNPLVKTCKKIYSWTIMRLARLKPRPKEPPGDPED
ncbi:MAG: spore cortex biosynthesis protein YabQ [Syntrophomonadaceae bacterium]